MKIQKKTGSCMTHLISMKNRMVMRMKNCKSRFILTALYDSKDCGGESVAINRLKMEELHGIRHKCREGDGIYFIPLL